MASTGQVEPAGPAIKGSHQPIGRQRIPAQRHRRSGTIVNDRLAGIILTRLLGRRADGDRQIGGAQALCASNLIDKRTLPKIKCAIAVVIAGGWEIAREPRLPHLNTRRRLLHVVAIRRECKVVDIKKISPYGPGRVGNTAVSDAISRHPARISAKIHSGSISTIHIRRIANRVLVIPSPRRYSKSSERNHLGDERGIIVQGLCDLQISVTESQQW